MDAWKGCWMKQVRKLKRDNKFYIGVFYTLNGILALILASTGMLTSYLYVLSGLILLVVLVNLVFAARTGNPGYLVTAVHYLVLTLVFGWAAMHDNTMSGTLFLVFCFTLLWVLYIGITRKVKWRREEILELAAKPVLDNRDGFTERPYPLGKAVYSEDELRSFSRFLFRHLVAVPYVEPGRVVLAITGHYTDHMLKIRRDGSRDTWVAFDGDGNISARIIKEDYIQYKEELTFDQLCESLGNLFREFLDLHQKGEEVRIIERLNELKIFPFTGGLIGF